MAMPAPSSTQINGANGTPYTVEGPILAKWETLTDAQKKDLGAPYDNQKNTLDNSGVYQQFDGGVLISRNGGPVFFVWGKIRDAWNANQASQGKLGYPTADEVNGTRRHLQVDVRARHDHLEDRRCGRNYHHELVGRSSRSPRKAGQSIGLPGLSWFQGDRERCRIRCAVVAWCGDRCE